MAEVSRILRVRLKTGLYEDLTRQATAEGYASLADWARYLLIQARRGPVGESQATLLEGPSPEGLGLKATESVSPVVGPELDIIEGESVQPTFEQEQPVSNQPFTDDEMSTFLTKVFKP